MIRAFVFAVVFLAAANTTLAQPHKPIGRFVVDVHGLSAGLPVDEGWTPVIPANAQAPARTLGLEFGGQVYVLRLGGATFGVGSTLVFARGKTTAPEPVSATPGTPPPAQTIPDVTTRLKSFAPQISLNFGHSLGWSYLSAGLGATNVTSEAEIESSTIMFVPLDSGWVKTINYGGGARWFINDHLGAGFDVRWYKLSPVPADTSHPGAPRASLFTIGAGISLK